MTFLLPWRACYRATSKRAEPMASPFNVSLDLISGVYIEAGRLLFALSLLDPIYQMALYSFPDISKEKIYPSNKDHVTCETEPFPFFDLPEEIIEKILKEYVPVSEKAGTLSEIPTFKQYLARERVWCSSTLKLFKLMGSIKPGWYVTSNNLRFSRCLLVDYFHLSVTIYYFDLTIKQARMPVHGSRHYDSFETFLKFQFEEPLVSVKDVLVYECHSFSFPIHFWIFKSPNCVRWRQGKDWQWSSFGRLKNNVCFILDENVHPHPLSLTLQKDLTVVLKCAVTPEKPCYQNVYTVVTPLSFQLCDEMDILRRPGLFRFRPSECTSCEQGVNYVHPRLKETFVDIESNTKVVSHTIFFSQLSYTAHYNENHNDTC